MKRNLIAAAAVALALAGNAALAEPTIDVFLGQDTVVWSKAPEATSYQDAQRAMSLSDELGSHIQSFNP